MTTKIMDDEKVAVNPHSPASEEALLGSILIDEEVMGEISVQAEDFYIQRNRWVYEAAETLRSSGRSIDLTTVCAELDRRGRLGQAGGMARVMELVTRTVSSLHAESYAAVIKEKARRRKVLSVATSLANSAIDTDGDVESAISRAMDALSRSIITDKGAVAIGAFVAQVYDEVEDAIKHPADVFGITTGFIDWDKITGGLQRGEVLKLSGEPGVGKSLLAVQVLCNAAAAGFAGALYELEMSGSQAVRRRLSAMAEVPTRVLRSGKISSAELSAFTRAVDAMATLPIYISDSSNMTTAELRADLTRLKDAYGIEVAVIDYEGLLGDEPDLDDTTRSKIISSRVHAIFKDLNIAGVVIDDMNKGGISGSVSGKAGLSGSARKLHDADQIVIVRKGDNDNTVRLTWEKMREGESGRIVDLVKLQGFPVFKDAQTARRSRE